MQCLARRLIWAAVALRAWWSSCHIGLGAAQLHHKRPSLAFTAHNRNKACSRWEGKWGHGVGKDTGLSQRPSSHPKPEEQVLCMQALWFMYASPPETIFLGPLSTQMRGSRCVHVGTDIQQLPAFMPCQLLLRAGWHRGDFQSEQVIWMLDSLNCIERRVSKSLRQPRRSLLKHWQLTGPRASIAGGTKVAMIWWVAQGETTHTCTLLCHHIQSLQHQPDLSIQQKAQFSDSHAIRHLPMPTLRPGWQMLVYQFG